MKDMIKDINKQPDEEYAGLGSEWSQEQELLSSYNWGALPFRHVDVFFKRKLSKLHSLGIFMETSSHRHDNNSISSLSPLPRGWGSGAESPKLLIMA